MKKKVETILPEQIYIQHYEMLWNGLMQIAWLKTKQGQDEVGREIAEMKVKEYELKVEQLREKITFLEHYDPRKNENKANDESA